MAGLTGMKAICDHMNRSEATMLKLHREYDFPMAKVCGIWESDTDEIDKWRKDMINGKSTLAAQKTEKKKPARRRAKKAKGVA